MLDLTPVAVTPVAVTRWRLWPHRTMSNGRSGRRMYVLNLIRLAASAELESFLMEGARR